MIVGCRRAALGAIAIAIGASACQHDSNLGTTAAAVSDAADAPSAAAWWVDSTWPGEHPRAIHGTSLLDVWIVGERGAMWRWGGAHFLALTSPDPEVALDAVWVASSMTAYVAGARMDGSSLVLAWDGATWIPEVTPASGALTGIWGTTSVGRSSTFLRRSSAGSWQSLSTANVVAAPEDIWVSGPDGDVWVAGGDGIRRFRASDGAFVADYPGDAVFGVWGRSADDVWAVGDGAIRRWNGTAWTATPTPSHPRLRAVWAASANHAWAVGDLGTLLRWDGIAWATEPPAASWNLYGVWGTGENNVFAVGSSEEAGGVLRYGEGGIGL